MHSSGAVTMPARGCRGIAEDSDAAGPPRTRPTGPHAGLSAADDDGADLGPGASGPPFPMWHFLGVPGTFAESNVAETMQRPVEFRDAFPSEASLANEAARRSRRC